MEPELVSSEVATPQTQVRYAGFGIRFLAYCVDFLILFVLGLMVQQMVGNSPFAIFQAQSLSEVQKIQGSGNSLLGIGIGLLLGLAYYLVFWVNYDGATPGKKLLAIKIVKDNGEKLTYPVAFVRWLGNMVSASTTFFFFIGYLWVIWDKKKQALHDKIAGTIVIKTDKQPQTAVAVFLTIMTLLFFFGYMALALAKGFSLGLREAQKNKGVVSESRLQENLKQNQEKDADKVLTFAPSSCGLTIPVPKTTDTNEGKDRKWLYEEVALATSEFYVLDKDVYPVKQVTGAFLAYKDANARLAGQNFSIAFPGLITYCVDNTKSYTLDEYVSLALTNKNYKIESGKKTYWGNIELMPITLQGKTAQGKDVADTAYLGVTKGVGSKLLYIRVWGIDDNDPNKTAISNDLDVIIRNIKYRNQEGASNVEGASDVRMEINSNVKGISTSSEQVKVK